VEHYRPKKGKSKDGHNGYYWLGYEWSNLILACSKCNNKKRSQFPIKGLRILNPDLKADGLPQSYHLIANSDKFLAEKPLLLNPEISNPENHIIVKPNGELKGITEEGSETIRICNLNRQELILRRRQKIEKYFNILKQFYSEFNKNKINDHELKNNIRRQLNFLFNINSPSKQFNLVWKFMWYKFDLFANSYLGKEEATATIGYYKEYLNSL
jgi:hypothetical protein